MKKNKILGIGIDIENISRFKKIKLSRENNFLTRIFTTSELDYCFSKKNIASSLATKYAGKEAVIKAFSLTDNVSPGYKEIEIINNSMGVPIVSLVWDKSKKYQILISLSNETDKTVGVAIVYNTH